MSSAKLAVGRSPSSGTLRRSGEAALAPETPKIPKHLSVGSLDRGGRRRLPSSTGNLHGYMAEDYREVSWPLPKMFGKEKYAYSVVDVRKDSSEAEDPRYVQACADMSQQLIRLQYDQQIVDLEWRKAYKALLDAEHRQSTLPASSQEKTKTLLKKEVDGCLKYLLELQEQKDMYEQSVQDIYSKCNTIKASKTAEKGLEDLRQHMEANTKDKIHDNSPFWRTKFNVKSQSVKDLKR
jgi:hypothetical protein